MSAICFDARLYQSEDVGPAILLSLPTDASAKLPTRGMTMVIGTVNGLPFNTALEPDGNGSHWFRISDSILAAIGVGSGDTVTVTIEPTKDIPEPRMPDDLVELLSTDAEARAIWLDITPLARWDWIRWIGAARLAETRKRRVDSVCSRLRSGKRRPCCFDRNQCTLTDA